jgi:hypothetical protein
MKMLFRRARQMARQGRVSEWSMETVLKTVEPATVPWVRIPPLPPDKEAQPRGGLFLLLPDGLGERSGENLRDARLHEGAGCCLKRGSCREHVVDQEDPGATHRRDHTV